VETSEVLLNRHNQDHNWHYPKRLMVHSN